MAVSAKQELKKKDTPNISDLKVIVLFTLISATSGVVILQQKL